MKYLDLKLLIFLLFFLFISLKACSQDFLNPNDFKNKIAKDIVAVEFWVDWNSSNEFAELSKLNDCEKYRVDIGKHPDLQENIKLLRYQLLLYLKVGEEKDRFKANIMFELEANKKEVQASIDNIMLAKFN